MAKREIKTTLAIDGEKQYKDSIASINAALKTLNSEMAAVTAEYKGNEDSIEALSARGDVLNKQYAEMAKKLEQLEKAHKNAAKQAGDDDKRTQEWARSVNYAKAQLAEIERKMDDVRRAADPLTRAIAESEEAAQDSANRIGYLSAELKALDAQYAQSKDSAEYLAKRQEILDRQYEESVRRVEAYERALRAVEQQSGKNSDEYRRMEATLNNARAEMYDAEHAARDMGSSSQQLGGIIKNLADKFGIQLPGGISNVLDALDDLKATSGKTGTSVTGDAGTIASALGGSGGVYGAALAAAGAIASIAAKAAEAAIEVETEAAKIKVALNLTEDEAEAANRSVANILLSGLTDSREEATAAFSAIYKIMGETGSKAETLAMQLLVIKQAFGEDYNEVVRTASTMTQTFGISGQEALDLIVAGLQSSANKGGDLLDVLNEYAPQFQRLGDDGEMFLNRLIKATDAGAWSADKAADAYKEFFVRAVDGSDEYRDALEKLGLDSDTTINALLRGGDDAASAMSDVMERIGNVADTAEQSRIAQKLFGSQWEDATTAPLLAMSEVEDGIIDTTNRATEAVSDFLDTTEVKLNAWWKRAGLKLLMLIIPAYTPEMREAYDRINAALNGTMSEVGVSSSVQSSYSGVTGGTNNYYDISIDASSVKEFNDIVDIAKNARQTRRAG
jgi:phage-related minor tail protein